MQSRYESAHMPFGLAGSRYLRFTALLTFVWLTVTIAS